MSKELEQKLIDFEDGQILGVKAEDGKVYLGVKKACIDIGMSENQARNETKKVQDNELFKMHNSVINLRVKFDTQVRETICIEERDVAIWLGQISLTPTMKKENPIATAKLLNYQDKASDVLHNAFMATEEQRQETFDSLGLKGQIIELNQRLDETIDKLNTLVDISTINSRQAQKLLFSAKDRVNTMLGGAHSEKYKKES